MRRSNGPLLKYLRYNKLIEIGIPYEIYWPLIAIEVAMKRAIPEPREGKASRNDSEAASYIIRIGIRYIGWTDAKNRGKPLSREKPNIKREFAIILKRPACHIQKIITIIRIVALRGPKISTRIYNTG